MIDFCSSAVLSDPSVAPPAMTHSQAVAALTDLLNLVPQVEIPVTHRFSPGVYCREVTMPAGATVIGHKHKTRHQNIALSGRAIVQIDGVTTEIVAPFVFESAPGSQKLAYIIEDLRWITIHANPENITDIPTLEDAIFDLPEEIRSSGLELDEYRMNRNKLPCQE